LSVIADTRFELPRPLDATFRCVGELKTKRAGARWPLSDAGSTRVEIDLGHRRNGTASTFGQQADMAAASGNWSLQSRYFLKQCVASLAALTSLTRPECGQSGQQNRIDIGADPLDDLFFVRNEVISLFDRGTLPGGITRETSCRCS
jgi:hypothetical protein